MVEHDMCKLNIRIRRCLLRGGKLRSKRCHILMAKKGAALLTLCGVIDQHLNSHSGCPFTPVPQQPCSDTTKRVYSEDALSSPLSMPNRVEAAPFWSTCGRLLSA